jgi:D-glycero-D-manno-heptose 1,7-bisphosphate phosphatase
MKQPAVFFDRDDTLVHDPGFISHPDQVQLLDDAPEAVSRLRRAGYLIVIVSNQSGVARGLLTEEDLAAIHHRLQDLFNQHGAALDAIYSCPYLDGPEAVVAAYRRASDLRKPAPGMLLQAAQDLHVDLDRSWMIGNSARDIEAGHGAGCRTVLIERGGPDSAGREAAPDHVARSLHEAAEIVLRADGHISPPKVKPAVTPSEQPAKATPGGSADAELLAVLSEIRELLDRSHRRRRQQDFSLLRLGGALLQMLAVVAAVWGLFGLASDAAAAAARFALAAFLQVAALTAMLSDRRE